MYICQMCIKLDWIESDLSGDFLDYPESFSTIQKNFYTIRKVSILSTHFLDCPDSFRLSGRSLDCPESF